jgi:hypothetical protein
LLCYNHFEQRLQLLAHSSLLGGGRLWAATQQHGRGGKVLRRPPEERRSVSVGIRALVGASVVVGLQPARRRRRCAAMRLVRSRVALAPIAIPLAGLPLHRYVLHGLSIMRIGVNTELLV